MSLERAQRYWGSLFGLAPEAFAQPGIKLVSHTTNVGYHNFSDDHALYVLRHGSALALFVPAQLQAEAQQRLETGVLETVW